MKTTLVTSNNLEWLQTEDTEIEPGRTMAGFKVGTCHGLVCFTAKTIELLAVVNNDPGNGHFNDVMEWLEYAAKDQKKQLKVIEVWNQRLKWHLIKKRGFIAEDQYTVFKNL